MPIWAALPHSRDVSLNQRVLKLMDRLALDQREAVLVHNPSNMFYLSGYTGEGLVLIDGAGNRAAAVCFGPEQVYFVISHSKVVDGGINTAIARIKKTACPPNARRQGLDTACARTGMCGPDCHDSMCRLTLAVDRAPRGRKITVLFVEETLGY